MFFTTDTVMPPVAVDDGLCKSILDSCTERTHHRYPDVSVRWNWKDDHGELLHPVMVVGHSRERISQ